VIRIDFATDRLARLTFQAREKRLMGKLGGQVGWQEKRWVVGASLGRCCRRRSCHGALLTQNGTKAAVAASK